jgi:predicted dehydrogenase
VKIAVIGLGFMGSTHVRALQSVDGATLAAVVSSDPLKLSGDLSGVGGNLGTNAGRLDFSSVAKYHTLESVLKDPAIDAVDICLPSDQHFEATLACLRAGKDVLVEKPLALDSASAQKLVEEAETAGRILMTGQVLRFIPEYSEVAQLLQNGRLGAVHGAFFQRRCGAPVWSRWQTDLSKSGGAVMDLLIHDLDFCLHLFGEPTAVSAVGHSDLAQGIDWMEARITFPHTGPVIVTGGWYHPKSYPFGMEFTVVSAGGTLEFKSGGGGLMLYEAGGSSENIPTSGKDPFVEELSYFVNCVKDRRRPALCPPKDSAMAVRLAEVSLRSRATGGEAISWAC